MKLLTSKKFALPKVYFITDKEEIKDLPVGVPFIHGDESIEEELIRILEYEVLYQEALKSGYPFNFKKILIDNGYTDIFKFWFESPAFMDFTTGEKGLARPKFDERAWDLGTTLGKSKFVQFIKDSAVYVDIAKLKALNVFPIWLETIEEAVHTNIHNFAVYNENMYNKKLEGMYGSLDLVAPDRNLIIIDISGSIPKAVSSTCLALAKNLAETFYADLMITGSKSTLYHYETLYELNVHTIYDENGMDNDQVYFKKLVTSDEKKYKTAIVFGDGHHPGDCWYNEFNVDTDYISDADGKAMCRWKVDKIISFHTNNKDGRKNLAGYARWFDTKEVEYIQDWLKYL